MTKEQRAAHISKIFKTYFNGEKRGSRARMASQMDVGRSYFSQMIRGIANISPARALQIETLTQGKISRRDLFPETWKSIWPDLHDQSCA